MLERVWRQGKPPTLLWECKSVQPLWRTAWRLLKKTKHRTIVSSSNSTPWHIFRENHCSKRYMLPMFTAVLFTIVKTWKQTKCASTYEWVKKIWYNHSGILLLFSCSVMSDSLWPHGLQTCRLPCLPISLRVCLNSCPLSWWCYLIISSSATPYPLAVSLSQQQG